MGELQTDTFTFEGIPNSEAAQIKNAERALTDAKAVLSSRLMQVGEICGRVQKILAGLGREGQFMPWYAGRMGFSKSTVYEAISAYERFGKCPTVGHFDTRALVLLSRQNIPEDAAKAAVKASRDGQRINEDFARRLIIEHTPASNGAPRPAKAKPDKATEFEPAELEKQKPRRKQGKELVSRELRKELQQAYGKLLNLLDDAGLSADADGPMRSILQLIKGA